MSTIISLTFDLLTFETAFSHHWTDFAGRKVRIYSWQVNYWCNTCIETTVRTPQRLRSPTECRILGHQSGIWLRRSCYVMEGFTKQWCSANTGWPDWSSPLSYRVGQIKRGQLTFCIREEVVYRIGYRQLQVWDNNNSSIHVVYLPWKTIHVSSIKTSYSTQLK